MKTACCLGFLLIGVTGTTGVLAHEPKPAMTATPPVAPAAAGAPPAAVDAAATPAAAIERFHAALASGDRQAALSLLDPKVVIFESGGAEMSRDEYASHHLDADMQFSRAVSSEIVHRESYESGDAAWVLTRTHTKGRFRGRDIDANGVETMVLRRDDGHWRIVHVHWSSGS